MPVLPTAFSPATVSRLAFANLVANGLIVVTGGAVRLTGSGLGCPTFPTCTEDSLVTTPEMGEALNLTQPHAGGRWWHGLK